MTFTRPVSFSEAAKLQAVKVALPTSLSSAEIRALGQDIYRRAQVSARVQAAEYLDTIAGLSQDLLAGKLDYATARLQLGKLSDMLDIGHDDARLNLILDTNTATARGYGQAVQANDPDVLDAFPAWELYRAEDRNEPRDWEQRWREAASASGDVDAARVLEESGRMVALKSSPIWSALGSNWDDSLGNPYPPFAFRSGMDVQDVAYEDALALGLVGQPLAASGAAFGGQASRLSDGEEGQAGRLSHGEGQAGRLSHGEGQARGMSLPGFNENFELSLNLRSAALQEEILKRAGDAVEFADGVLRLKGGTR